MNFKFHPKNFIIFILLFLIEIGIALFIHDKFIRPFLGDVLVVLLMYYFIKSFFTISTPKLLIGIFIFSVFVEFLQYMDVVKRLGFQNNRLISVVVGRYFSWYDILCYLAGCLFIYFISKKNV